MDICGGLSGKPIKATDSGPSGGLSQELLDTPVDYEKFAKVSSIMGSGG